MPSHQQNLDAVRAAAVRANPDIEGANQGSDGLARDQEIRAADVLLALHKVSPYHWALTDSGTLFMVYRDLGKSEIFGVLNEPWTSLDLRAAHPGDVEGYMNQIIGVKENE